MESYLREIAARYPLNDLDNLRPPSLVLPHTTLETQNFFDTSISYSLSANPSSSCSCQNTMMDFFAGILTKAISTMIRQAATEQNTDTGGHVAVDLVRKLIDEL